MFYNGTQCLLLQSSRLHKVMLRLEDIHRNTHIINKPCLVQNSCIRTLNQYVTFNSIR